MRITNSIWTALPAPVLWHSATTILTCCRASKVSLPAACRYILDLTTPLKDRFSEYLLSLLPGEGKEYCLQFTGPSGADAVEAALKLAKNTPVALP